MIRHVKYALLPFKAMWWIAEAYLIAVGVAILVMIRLGGGKLRT